MIECDICRKRRVIHEAIYDDGYDSMIILSTCGEPVCENAIPYTRISNWVSLDNAITESVE